MENFRQKFIEALKECRDSLADAVVTEPDVEQHIIQPIVTALGWPNRSVKRQYLIETDTKRWADFVLLDEDKNPAVLIEAKAPGVDLEFKGKAQLFNYAYNSGIDMLLLTNGERWIFYLSWIQGIKGRQIEDRQFASLNLKKDNIDIISDKLVTFLSREHILKGLAQKSAGREWNLHNDRKKLREEVPEILNHRLQNIPEQWAQDIAKDLSIDYSIDDIRAAVCDYYKSLRANERDNWVPNKPIAERTNKPKPARKSPAPKEQLVVHYKGRTYKEPKAADTFAKVISAIGVSRVYKICRKNNITMVGDYHVVLEKGQSIDPKYGPTKKVDGYQVVTHSNTKDKKRRLSDIAEALGLEIRIE